MFISIAFTERINDPDNKMYQLLYVLEDTEFTVKLNISIQKSIYDNRGDTSIIPSGIISTYQGWKQNVPKNLAIFYVKSIGHLPVLEQNKLLYNDRVWTDEHFSQLEYTKKYFKCMVNQMKIFKYTGIPINAQHIIGTIQ